MAKHHHTNPMANVESSVRLGEQAIEHLSHHDMPHAVHAHIPRGMVTGHKPSR